MDNLIAVLAAKDGRVSVAVASSDNPLCCSTFDISENRAIDFAAMLLDALSKEVAAEIPADVLEWAVMRPWQQKGL